MEVYTLNDAMAIYNELYGEKPTDISGKYATRTLHYYKRLLRRAISTFDIEGCPEDWDIEWVKKILLVYGYLCIGNVEGFGAIPMKCSVTGHNIYNRPTKCLVANPVFGNKEFTIGKDCVLIKLQNDYQGFSETLSLYAEKFANVDAGIDMNLLNSRNAWIFDCSDKVQEETAKKMYEDITAGKPAVFRRSPNNSNLHDDGKIDITMLNVKNTYIGDILQEQKRELRYEFLTELGINNSNVFKKERVNTDEVNANNEELRNSIDDWKSNLEEGFARANEMFGLNLTVIFPYLEHLEKVEDVESEVDKAEVDGNSKPKRGLMKWR